MILAKRAEGISQNLHRALDRHKQLVTEDVTAALVEHTRSSILYERQLLRELEALKPDVSNANKKHIPPAKANGAPRPSYVPPLEDFSKPAPRPASAAPTGSFRAPALSASISQPGSSRAANASPRPPLPASPTASVTASIRSLPPQSPGAGPSSPAPQHASFNPPLMDGPPLGGRFVDGTKSMFVKPPSSPLAPSSTIPRAGSPLAHGRDSPLRATTPMSAAAIAAAAPQPHPLASSMGPLGGSLLRSNNIPESSGPNAPQPSPLPVDPLTGMPITMSQSVRLTPQRPRLDAREAASKLANMF